MIPAYVDLARSLRDRIRRFGYDCSAGETDTGEAWEILEDVEEYLAHLVKSHGPPTAGERGVIRDSEHGDTWFTVAPRDTDPHGATTIRYDDGGTALNTWGDIRNSVNDAGGVTS